MRRKTFPGEGVDFIPRRYCSPSEIKPPEIFFDIVTIQ
jgi:hypothetical protein